jgi:hypothetical protein
MRIESTRLEVSHRVLQNRNERFFAVGISCTGFFKEMFNRCYNFPRRQSFAGVIEPELWVYRIWQPETFRVESRAGYETKWILLSESNLDVLHLVLLVRLG